MGLQCNPSPQAITHPCSTHPVFIHSIIIKRRGEIRAVLLSWSPQPWIAAPPPLEGLLGKEGPGPRITEARVPGERCAKGCGGEGAVCGEGGRGGRGFTGRGRPAASRRAAPQANPSGPPFQSRPRRRVRGATGRGGSVSRGGTADTEAQSESES